MRNTGIEQHPNTLLHACSRLLPRQTSASAPSLFCFDLFLSLTVASPPPSCNCSECTLSPPTTLHSRPSSTLTHFRSTRFPSSSPAHGQLPQHGDQGYESPQLWRRSCGRHLFRHDGRRARHRHSGGHHGPRPQSAQQEDHGKAGPVLRGPLGQGSKEDKDGQTRRPNAQMVAMASMSPESPLTYAGTKNCASPSTTRPTTTASRSPSSTTTRRRSLSARPLRTSTPSSPRVEARATNGSASTARASTLARSAWRSPTTTPVRRTRSRYSRKGESRPSQKDRLLWVEPER